MSICYLIYNTFFHLRMFLYRLMIVTLYDKYLYYHTYRIFVLQNRLSNTRTKNVNDICTTQCVIILSKINTIENNILFQVRYECILQSTIVIENSQ